MTQRDEIIAILDSNLSVNKAKDDIDGFAKCADEIIAYYQKRIDRLEGEINDLEAEIDSIIEKVSELPPSYGGEPTDNTNQQPKLPEKMPIGFEPDDQYELGLAIRINSIIDYLKAKE